MPGIKVQRVDFSASDWLGGTSTLSLQECGLYIKICALIYVAGGPVTKADVRKIVSCRYQTLSSLLLRLVEKGKITFEAGLIDQKRCERELARARRRIEAKFPIGDESATTVAEMEPEVLSDNKEVSDPHARAKGNQREKEDLKNIKGDLGRCAPSLSTEAMVEQVTATLRGNVPKGIRDPAAYKAAVKENKFHNLVRKVNGWVGCHLDGAARLEAWETLADADAVNNRMDLSRDRRQALDRLIEMYRVTEPLEEAAE